MSEEFDIVEIPFEELEISKTLEDEFTEARIVKLIDSTENVEELKDAAIKLLKVATARQAAIRGLCKRLVQYETMAMQHILDDKESGWT